MTEPTPHITELLDLREAVTASSEALIVRFSRGAVPDTGVARQTLDSMTHVDRIAVENDVLAVLYPAARLIAEQAYERALDSARAGTPLEAEVNPFADDRVTT